MIRYFYRLTVLLGLGLGLLLTGCADVRNWMGSVGSSNGSVSSDSSVVDGSESTDDSESIDGSESSASLVVSDCRRIASLPAAEQKGQVESLQAAFERSGGDRERLVLACLAVHPKSQYQNHTRALKLLQGYRRSEQPREDLLALTDLLEELLLQKQRTEQQLVEERRRSESLASKLKALEDIEKIIQEREEKALPSP